VFTETIRGCWHDGFRRRSITIDRHKILKQLARIMNQVAEGNENIARHRKAVAESERDGQAASLTQKLLKYTEHVQTINLAEQHRLKKLLGEKIDEPGSPVQSRSGH
jgi:hypothetical protein